MHKYQSSLTAQGIAIVRAMESEKPENQRICYDPYARYLINPALAALVRLFMRLGYAEKRGPGVWEFLTARERYIDDYLARSLEQGVQQVVILGAGFDTRSLRFQAPGIKFFEVDHAATQNIKIEKLSKSFPRLPDCIIFVPVDFEVDRLAERLLASGYDAHQKTLFIWQGVIHYLTPQAVDDTLSFIALNSARGSAVIFDYVYASVIEGRVKRGEAASMHRNRWISGEEMRFGIEEGKVAEFLQGRGFEQVKNVSAADLHDLYFKDANAKRMLAPVYAIASAVVGQNGVRHGAGRIESLA